MKVQLCIPDGLHLLRPFLNVHGLVTALFVELSTRGAEWAPALRRPFGELLRPKSSGGRATVSRKLDTVAPQPFPCAPSEGRL